MWLLVDRPDGTLRANYPGRFVKNKETSVVRSLIAKNPIRLLMRKLGHKGQSVVLRVVLTNAGSDEMVLPWFQVRSNGTVEWPEMFSLTVLHTDSTAIDPDSDEPHWYWSLMGVADDNTSARHHMRKLPLKRDSIVNMTPPTLLRLASGDFSKRDMPLIRLLDLPRSGHFVMYMTTATGWRSNTLLVPAVDLF